MPQKKRDTTRVEFHTRAELEIEGQVVSGTVEDLSLKGMFLKTDASQQSIQIGQEVMVTIRFSGTTSNLSIDVQGKVVRLTQQGLGIEFTDMEFDSFVYLRNVVAYNAGDEDAIMDEFSRTFTEL
ncbi:MAG: PilZ domain-containing protein [Spirochaetia bacterium]|nr:PilZ domain-containing protein [Spirochaetia bacterium]